MRTLALLSLLTAFATGAGAAALDDLIRECTDCHGDDGVSRWEDVPTIAGVAAFNNADSLYRYRDEARPCRESEYRQGDTERAAESMCEVAADLTDDQIEALAEHYAGLPFVPAKQPFDADKAAAGAAVHNDACERCHIEGGKDPSEEAGILAGQWLPYLREAFEDYAADKREQPKKMREKMAELSAEDVEALLHYYASQQ